VSKPPYGSKGNNSNEDNAVVIHSSDNDREGIWEAKADIKENYRSDGNSIYGIAIFAHPFSTS
jgi:hypothetical protein